MKVKEFKELLKDFNDEKDIFIYDEDYSEYYTPTLTEYENHVEIEYGEKDNEVR